MKPFNGIAIIRRITTQNGGLEDKTAPKILRKKGGAAGVRRLAVKPIRNAPNDERSVCSFSALASCLVRFRRRVLMPRYVKYAAPRYLMTSKAVSEVEMTNRMARTEYVT